MLNFLASLLGQLMRWIYDSLVGTMAEPKDISFYAITIIIMTLLVSIITIPVTISSQKQAEKSQSLKPKIDEIQKKYGYDPQIMQQKMQQLYKEEGASPGLSSCLPMIFQLIIIFALLRVMNDTTKFVFPEGFSNIRTDFYWVPSLLEMDPYRFGLPLLTSLSQIAVQLFTMKTNPQMQAQEGPMGSMNTMMLILPLAYFFMFRGLPAGLPLYWTMSSLIRLIIMVIMHYTIKKPNAEILNEKVNNKTSENKRRSN